MPIHRSSLGLSLNFPKAGMRRRCGFLTPDEVRQQRGSPLTRAPVNKSQHSTVIPLYFCFCKHSSKVVSLSQVACGVNYELPGCFLSLTGYYTIHTHTQSHTCVHMHTLAHTCIHHYAHTNACTRVHIYTCTHMHTPLYTRTHKCTCGHTMRTYVHTLCAHNINAHIHAHAHTLTQPLYLPVCVYLYTVPSSMHVCVCSCVSIYLFDCNHLLHWTEHLAIQQSGFCCYHPHFTQRSEVQRAE